MNWDAIGAIGEILGALAVFVTLVYLASQIKQSNDVSRFNASKDIMNQFNEINKLLATDSTMGRVLLKEGELSADENEQEQYNGHYGQTDFMDQGLRFSAS